MKIRQLMQIVTGNFMIIRAVILYIYFFIKYAHKYAQKIDKYAIIF